MSITFFILIYRQHWFISRLNGASVTAGGFPPTNSNVLIITTSSNQVYVFDVEAKQLGKWSKQHTSILPRRFQEFPGEIIGLSFPPSSNSTSVIIYSARYSQLNLIASQLKEIGMNIWSSMWIVRMPFSFLV